MMLMNKTVMFTALLTFCGLVLSGCNDKIKSEEWYMAHHEALISKYGECLNAQTFTSEECVPAVNAYHRTKDEPDIKAGVRKVNDDFNQKMMQGVNNE